VREEEVMAIIIGFVMGYVVGTRAGPDGFAEVAEAVRTISASEEVRDLVQAGLSVAGDLLGRGGQLLGGEPSGSRSSTGLHRAA